MRDEFEVAPRAFFEVGRRNLFGKNPVGELLQQRQPSPERSGVLCRSACYGVGRLWVPEYRLLGTFREPRLFDTAFDGFATLTFEQQMRSSFNFSRRSASAEAARKLPRDLAVSGSYQIQRTRLFDVSGQREDLLLIDKIVRAVPPVVVFRRR